MKKINQVFELYSKGKYLESKKLNDEILAEDPNNMYALRYAKILSSKIGNNLGEKEKKVKVKGKTLKCPHCLARIPFSSLTEEQRKLIKTGNYNNLEIKCPYCHTSFVLQKKKAPSVLGLKIGDFANFGTRKYRVVGNVYYEGKWEEGNYSGRLWYLEWILLGENGDYKYFSEGGYYDDGIRFEEFELSYKVIPDFSLEPDYNENYILINNEKYNFKEKNIVSVKSIYGENSKKFTVGEKVELYEFSYKQKNYVIEKEKVGSQVEAGIYETKKYSRKEAFNLFGKDYYSSYYSGKSYENSGFFQKVFEYGIWGFFGIIFLASEGIISFSFFLYGIGLVVGIFFIKFLFDILNKNSGLTQTSKNIILFFILVPLLSIISYFVFNNILDTKKEITLQNIKQAKKIELMFTDPSLKEDKVVSRQTYDYGGVRTYYEKTQGLKFSVLDENDKKVINKIKEILSGKNTFGNTNNEEKIKRIFENSKIYLIRE